MHQQSRHLPRISSPATNPQTNPARTNNSREPPGAASRARSGSEALEKDAGAALDAAGEGAAPVVQSPTADSIKKLDQIIQNFHHKAATLILQSRMNVTPIGGRRPENKKLNKWFQIETDEIDDFKDELRIWRTAGSFENHPPPMILETYLDASQLSNSQTLVVIDEYGKRWDALEALNSSDSSAEGSPRRFHKRNTEIILERWRVELRCTSLDDLDDFGPGLPSIYKRSIIFFRSLFVTTKVMPCWKYFQHTNAAKALHPALEVRCRFLTAEPEYTAYDPLRQPLFDGRDAVTDYMFGDLEVPVGRLYASVTYRNDCNFRVDDSESLMNSRYMVVDDNFFRPSIPPRGELRRTDSYTEIGSLPAHREGRGPLEPQQTYGSLSTFHGAGALGTSPMTALKAVRPAGSDTSSPPGSVPASVEPDPPHSLPIRPQSRPTLRSLDRPGRRSSVSFQPFKAGSLSGSPRITESDGPPASPLSLARPSGLSGISQARNRSSLTAGMAASLRGGPPPNITPATPVESPPIASSPKPSRYGSSFTHRRARPSFGGQSKAVDDDQTSSGKQSLSSSAQPGSGLLAEVGAGGSSGSLQTDDDNISDFLKVLDSSKKLPSFEPNKKGETSTAKRTAQQLSKFHLMRESNNALTESMTSSMHLHRSSSSSSRQLANVPAMVNPASMSASSSPGKPLSPHTPHTPAIPSRLSENSIIDYAQGQATIRQPRNQDIVAMEVEENANHPPVSQDGTTAIPIPLSPRLLHTNMTTRRASSVAARALAGADDDSDTAQRSFSLGTEDREAPTLSTLLALQHPGGGAPSSGSPGRLQPAPEIRAASADDMPSPSIEREVKSASPGFLPSTASTGRRRYPGYAGLSGSGRPTPPQSTRGSFSGGRFTAGGSMMRGAGGAGAGDEDDNEPLVFAMSELERDSRRSLEDGRGSTGGPSGAGTESGSAAGSTEKFEPRGTTRRGW